MEATPDLLLRVQAGSLIRSKLGTIAGEIWCEYGKGALTRKQRTFAWFTEALYC